MHPGAALFLWVALVVLLQTLSGPPLWLVTGLWLGVAGWLSFPTLRRLVRRIRFLLLAILILFAWMTPGQAALPLWTTLGPTREGLLLAADHGLRLVGVVALVALLLGRGGRDFVVSGLYALMAPCRLLGLSRDRLAVRLLLVLRHAESSPPDGWRHWLDPLVPRDEAEALHVRRIGFRGRDWLVLALAFGLLAVLGIR
jgi:energy-coupling factor transporter transmembrane protein EcfT